MYQETDSQPGLTFKESVRKLHNFLLESRESGDIDMRQIGNFVKREGLKFGNHSGGDGLERYKYHLQLLEEAGAIEFVDGEDTQYVRVLGYQEE
ncbi:hypothetical protein A2V80_00685 [Candidatus Woesebacteria bacterium RBG_16_39_8b]|uniref:Uncharacterized protein n=1 Tax=Candidatus Woesebacteria bacterium RBG_16_39_8b TaxID=1802482 RepID=A0A1F7XHN2_9BACT|nr:MAG: hypothetical protein A2V80_00685 [Candidatus Woesebacteria bacterium RBG_16_39_8b]